MCVALNATLWSRPVDAPWTTDFVLDTTGILCSRLIRLVAVTQCGSAVWGKKKNNKKRVLQLSRYLPNWERKKNIDCKTIQREDKNMRNILPLVTADAGGAANVIKIKDLFGHMVLETNPPLWCHKGRPHSSWGSGCALAFFSIKASQEAKNWASLCIGGWRIQL